MNADEAAGKVAARLRAHKAIFLTDVDGWLADPDDPGSRISETTVEEVEGALDGWAAGYDPSSERASRRSGAAYSTPTSSTGAGRTRCCWSCSRTRE